MKGVIQDTFQDGMICLSMKIIIIGLILLCGPLFRSGGLRIKGRLG